MLTSGQHTHSTYTHWAEIDSLMEWSSTLLFTYRATSVPTPLRDTAERHKPDYRLFLSAVCVCRVIRDHIESFPPPEQQQQHTEKKE